MKILILTKIFLFVIFLSYANLSWILYKAKDGIVRQLTILHFVAGAWCFAFWAYFLFNEPEGSYAEMWTTLCVASVGPFLISFLIMYFIMFQFHLTRNERKYRQMCQEMEETIRKIDYELFETMESFKALTETSPDVIMRFDRKHRHLYVNKAIKEHAGLNPEDVIGKTHEELGFPEYLINLWGDAIDVVFKTGARHRLEFQLPNGKWMDWYLFPEKDQVGKVKYVLSSSRDITHTKKQVMENFP